MYFVMIALYSLLSSFMEPHLFNKECSTLNY